MLSETLEMLNKHGVKLDKRKGQNYLINRAVLDRIVKSSDLTVEDTVLEIGAGIGTLTIPLAEHAGKIIAVEQDKKIAQILNERLAELNISNVDVINDDATRMDLPEFNKVVSNLPYKISSPITFKILNKKFDYAILMYQREFAERMTAYPGDSNYSRLSVMMELCADVELLFHVSKNVFFPKPKVSSAVVKLKPKENRKVDDFFLRVTRALFQHKRKKARNALMDSFHEIADVEKDEKRIIISKIDDKFLNQRVFKLTPFEIMELSNNLKIACYS